MTEEIIKPKGKLKDLPEDAQKIFKTILNYLIGELAIDISAGISREEALSSMIELVNAGILKVIQDDENDCTRFELYDFTLGRYVNVGRPRTH